MSPLNKYWDDALTFKNIIYSFFNTNIIICKFEKPSFFAVQIIKPNFSYII